MRTIRTLSALALTVLAASAFAGVINFEGYGTGCNGLNCSVGSYAARGVTFVPATQGICSGVSNGDPGNWDLEGVDGPSVLCFNGINPGYTIDIQFNSIRNLHLSAARALGGSPGQNWSYLGSRGATPVWNGSFAFGNVNQWTNVAFLQIDRLQLSSTDSWGLDRLVYKHSRGDVGANGHGDLIWRNNATGETAVWQMSFFSASGTYLPSVATSWNIVGQNDFNGDGKSDLLWFNPSSREVAIWLMNGGTYGSALVFALIPSEWNIIGTGDFNGDDRADILLRSSATNMIALWYMDGTTLTSGEYFPIVPSANWQLLSTGDFNGDGRTGDLLWRHNTSRQVAIWTMDGVNLTGAAFVATPPAEWQFIGAADHTGDLTDDLVWRNTSTGQNAAWLVQGSTIDSTGYLPSVAGTDWVLLAPR